MVAGNAEARPAMISVRGRGRANGRPDAALLHVAIERTAPSMAAALTAAEADTQRLFGALPAVGIDADAVNTVGIMTRPDHDPRAQAPAFTAGATFSIRLAAVEGVGAVVDHLVGAVGDNLRVHNVSFVVSDNAELEKTARGDAIEHARGVAEQLAAAAGGRLGRITSISEGMVGPIPGGPGPVRLASAPFPPPIPMQPGESVVHVDLFVTVELRFDEDDAPAPGVT